MTTAAVKTTLITLLLALLLAPQAQAQTHTQAHAKHPAKHAPAKPKVLKVSTLKGRFSFTLPNDSKGYSANAMQDGDEASGAQGAKGTMYTNPTEKRVVIVSQMPTPTGQKVGDYDATFLDTTVADYLSQQSAALPDFKKLGDKEFTVKGLGVRQIDSSATQGGGRTLATTFLAASGTTLSIVQVISRFDDQKGHDALVKKIAGMR
ncbi:hypothetical protein [Pseudomonas abieticivorans]|uniref:hypothetical protein n=1 Tax=Pseudomonas abieticivorans TaxID=2931382 RepID=UPI0020BFDDB5|nr:hypothetical protein [Pseudomonas sp. PIA16]